jgi:hypothetical protein
MPADGRIWRVFIVDNGIGRIPHDAVMIRLLAAMMYLSSSLATTVTIQRVGLLALTSMTERTNPVTSDPFTVNVVLWARCWS